MFTLLTSFVIFRAWPAVAVQPSASAMSFVLLYGAVAALYPEPHIQSGHDSLDRRHYFDKTGNVEQKNALAALAGLSQESRLDVFRLLVERGPEGMPAGAIAERLGMANATLSFHLKELSHAGLITGRQAGRFIYYSPNFETVNGLVDYLTENCCRGASCVVACVPSPKGRRKVS